MTRTEVLYCVVGSSMTLGVLLAHNLLLAAPAVSVHLRRADGKLCATVTSNGDVNIDKVIAEHCP